MTELSLIAEQMPHLVWLTAVDGTIQYVNRQATSYTGHAETATRDWDPAEALHPDDADLVARRWRRARRDKQPFDLDQRMRRFDGEFRWHRVRSRPIRNASDSVVRWLVTATDIDDSRNVEDELRAAGRQSARTLALLETLQSHAPVGLGFVDRDIRRVLVNERMAEFANSSVADQLGRLVSEVVPDFWDELEPLYTSVLETGSPVLDVEVSGPSPLDPTLTRHWVNSYYPVTVDGETIGVGIVAIEISDRKRAEEHSRQLAAIVEQANDAILTASSAGIVTSWNKAAEALFGYAAEEIIGCSLAILAPADMLAGQNALRVRLAAGGPAERYEVTRQRKDGSLVHLLATSSPMIAEDGTVTGVSVIAIDMTERVRERDIALHAQRQLAEAQRVAQIGSFEADLLTGAYYWSDELYRLLGFDTDVAPTVERFMSRIAEEDRVQLEVAIAGCLERGTSWVLSHRIVVPDEPVRWVETRVVGEIDANGTPFRLTGTLRDNTEKREANRVAEEAQKRFEVGFEQAGVGTAILDMNGLPVRLNAAVCDLLGRPEEELLGRSWEGFTHPDEVSLKDAVLANVAAGHDTYAAERRFLRSDGSVMWTSLYLTMVRDDAGAPTYYLVQLQDITERKGLEAELVHQALHDSLTGLANRGLLKDRMSSMLAGARHRGAHLGVIVVNIDHFKTINDTYGHGVGDDLLCEAARIIAACIREVDTVARFGGDEFVIVCEDDTGQETATVARVVREAVEGHYVVGIHEMQLTASIGVAVSDDAATPETLLRDADAAMSRAKGLGRDRVEIFDDVLRARAQRAQKLSSGLRHALARNELIIQYQPVVDLTTGRLVSSEALVRWEHPTLGVVGPAEFIPLAEETGLIVGIGAWVLEEACWQLREWQSIDPSVTLAVNLSVRQMLSSDLVALVSMILRSTGIAPATLCLELTESGFMEDADYFGATLAALKELGVTLSIDDFGTGYSSLSYLKNFPVDAVKIDRSFVEGLATDHRDYSLVAAIMAMATALDLSVTAEGIETREQLGILKDLHCHRVQGYLLSVPLAADALTALLRDKQTWDVT